MTDQKLKSAASATNSARNSYSSVQGIITKYGYIVRFAWVRIFVTREGRVGYWIRECPNCGYEHTHGSYPPFDPREFANGPKGRRAPHCKFHPRSPSFPGGRDTYELRLVDEPAYLAPGAERSRLAKDTMQYPSNLGIEVSDKTIPSEMPTRSWRWR